MYHKKAHIHFVGIGGIGMSGIATILKHQGYEISGCDGNHDQQSITDLKRIGCSIYLGNNTPACHDTSIEIVVYSTIIRPHHPEIVAAQLRGIPTIARALMLAELMRTKYSIAIAGAHGKTTTTSLISHILIEAGIDPTVIIGGHLKNISANARIGNGEFLVAEADESDRSFLHLQATLAVVTNIDLEHVETYLDLDDIKATFKQFINNLPFYGKVFVCIDDPHLASILPIAHIKTVKYGLSAGADISASSVELNADHSLFMAHQTGKALGVVRLNMPGHHNMLNSLGAIAVALDVGVPFDVIAHALQSFKGIERRFSYKGTFYGAELFDDYGHHPVEIANTLLVARRRTRNKLTVVFQPHRYTRTDKLWHSFLETFALSSIDTLIVTDIYPAFESPITGVTSERFVQALKAIKPPFDVYYIPFQDDFADIKRLLEQVVKPQDLIVSLGAGKITKLSEYL